MDDRRGMGPLCSDVRRYYGDARAQILWEKSTHAVSLIIIIIIPSSSPIFSSRFSFFIFFCFFPAYN